MRKAIKFLTKTYNRRLISQSILAIIIFKVGMNVYYSESYSIIVGLPLYLIGGALTVTTGLLIVEYLRHILLVYKNRNQQVKAYELSSNTSNSSNYDIDYIGPRTISIILLTFTVILSFFAILAGVISSVEPFLNWFSDRFLMSEK